MSQGAWRMSIGFQWACNFAGRRQSIVPVPRCSADLRTRVGDREGAFAAYKID